MPNHAYAAIFEETLLKLFNQLKEYEIKTVEVKEDMSAMVRVADMLGVTVPSVYREITGTEVKAYTKRLLESRQPIDVKVHTSETLPPVRNKKSARVAKVTGGHGRPVVSVKGVTGDSELTDSIVEPATGYKDGDKVVLDGREGTVSVAPVRVPVFREKHSKQKSMPPQTVAQLSLHRRLIEFAKENKDLVVVAMATPVLHSEGYRFNDGRHLQDVILNKLSLSPRFEKVGINCFRLLPGGDDSKDV